MSYQGPGALTSLQVQNAFIASPPLIAQSVLDMTVKYPNFMRDLYTMEEFPLGAGTTLYQLIFRGEMPSIERGFDQWKKLDNNTGCNPGAGPDCDYNWTSWKGTSLERRAVELMSRDFKTNPFCVAEIQSTYEFKTVFTQIVQHLYNQINFFKEFNIGQNFLTGLAKKFVVDSTGIQPNPQNPYVYRDLGTAQVSILNIQMLTFFYEQMRRMPDTIPFDIVDGNPLFACMASQEVLARLWLDDPQVRQDVRFSGFANDLVNKYNIQTTIRGMFWQVPNLYPRRFTVTGGANTPLEILPFVNNVPGEVGVYTQINPAYQSADYEEVLLFGKSPFKVFYLPTETSLGQNTSFGPEYSFLDNLLWINPLTKEDPARRSGYFFTSAKIGLSPQFSEGILGILVKRASIKQSALFLPDPACPPTPVECNNAVPAVGCPCPLVVTQIVNPLNALQVYYTLSVPVTGTVGDAVQLELANGGFITGTLAAISSDRTTISITYTTVPPVNTGNQVVGIFCSTSGLLCSATVTSASDCRSDVSNYVKLFLSNPIKATEAGQIISAVFGDGTTANLQVVSTNQLLNEWNVQYATGYGPTDAPTGGSGGDPLTYDIICDRSGIASVCVPPSTDASCPACLDTLTACS